MTPTETTGAHVETMNGTVHYGRRYVAGGVSVYGPACRKYAPHELHACLLVDFDVTCKRCLKNRQPEEPMSDDFVQGPGWTRAARLADERRNGC